MPAPLSLTIADYLAHACPNLRLAALVASVSANAVGSDRIGAALEAIARDIAAAPDPMAHPRLVAMDETFRRAGANPKRYAPAASALVKRIAQGRDLARISDLVDTNNVLSLTLRIPCGIYDRDHIAGSRLTFDLGAMQPTYLGVDQVEQRTQGKLLLTDRDKVLGGPHADAYPTRITPETRHVLVVLYLPDRAESPLEVRAMLDEGVRLFEGLCGAAILGTIVGE